MAKSYFNRIFKRTLLLFVIVSFSCSSNTETAANELLKVDIEYSNMSKTEGRNKAVVHYIDQYSVFLKPQKQPIVGKNAILNILSRNEDKKSTLTWEPTSAFISESGDLGYTYGTYKMKKRRKITKGTYVTIWKKNKEGEWKFVLNSGNEGLERMK